ncbi:hypothetical protein [Aestuariivivens sediminis]|uniref:hypothetical protein n=1 Tax=Aestuariivivens sediminis TaxID=2913557 RepID=UPI001F581D8C|nr:hypothetical protein [Aestuariivivens sediminis]
MKTIYYIFLILFILSCSSAKVIDIWVSKEHANYQPKKVLVIGVTDNLTARKIFEEDLTNELKNRGVYAVESYDEFDQTFTNLKQNEEDIEREIQKLNNGGFDTILISVVKGIDERTSYSGNRLYKDYYWRRFGRYYYLYQDIYLVEGYYDKYKVYHVEASLYNLKENNDKSLVWVASYDIVNPKKIASTIKNYVTAIIISLEQEQIIPKKIR